MLQLERNAPLGAIRESPYAAMKTQHTKNKEKNFKTTCNFFQPTSLRIDDFLSASWHLPVKLEIGIFHEPLPATEQQQGHLPSASGA